MKTALTIAGSDSSGGAGIQADIKTMMANGVYAMSAVTALTAQNTTGVTDILESTPYFLGEQLDAVFTDIFPDAVKIGMVSSAELITVIAEKPGDGGHLRGKAPAAGCHGSTGQAAAYGRGADPQYSRGGNPLWTVHHGRNRHGDRRKEHQ